MSSIAADEARDARALVPIDPAFSNPAHRARVGELLTSYPSISESELDEIVSFLHSGKQFDVGMVCGDEQYKEKISAIRKSHKHSFGSTLSHTLWFLALLIVPLALVCYLPVLLGRS